jgi:hypothetical protein
MQRPAGQGWLTRRYLSESRCGIFAAVSGESNLPALLIEASAQAIPAQMEHPSGRGFEVNVIPIQPGPQGRVYLALQLAEPGYRNVFGTLVEDVAAAVAEATTEHLGVLAFVARLRIWQEFMRRHSEGLSQDEQVGLFGELSVLQDVIFPHFAAGDAIRIWQGPQGGEHDFVFGGLSVEVKTTLRSPPVGFQVANLVQLDEARCGRLVLAFCGLVNSPTGQSLPEFIANLSNAISSQDASAGQLLLDRLLAAGYVEDHAALYSERRYRLQELRLFEIQDGFPRLRANDVPAGVTDCSYQVDLAACEKFRIPRERLDQHLNGEGHRAVG